MYVQHNLFVSSPYFPPPLPSSLLQTFVKAHHKVGVLRIKTGQSSEEEIFANSNEPGAFDEFLNVLGTQLPLYAYNLT